MEAPPLGVRFYQIDEGEEIFWAVTCGLEVRLATPDYLKAARYYADMQGLDPRTVDGPTHCVEEELELAERLALSR